MNKSPFVLSPVSGVAALIMTAIMMLAGAPGAKAASCGPYAMPGRDANGNLRCISLPPEARKQIIRARQLAVQQRVRNRQLAIEQRQRRGQSSRQAGEQAEQVEDRELSLAREQRQPEEELKQDIRRRTWPYN